ncbi:MAG: hypothetical protein FWC55_08905 [Firmicutes bacterium]|nr:hypothetical protein [Bacillota bacterium]
MKHKKLFRAILIIMCVWFAIFAADMLCVSKRTKPVFTLTLAGGEVIEYAGLGYIVSVYYPFSDNAESDGPVVSVNPAPYIVLNVFLIGFLAALYLAGKRAKKNKDNIPRGGI